MNQEEWSAIRARFEDEAVKAPMLYKAFVKVFVESVERKSKLDAAYAIVSELVEAMQRGDAEILPGPSKRDWGYVAWWQRCGAWLNAHKEEGHEASA